MQNTPGPWTVAGVAGKKSSYAANRPDKLHIIGADSRTIAIMEASPAKARSNAKLIASAPALLAALQEALVSMSCGSCDRSVPCKRCESALDNARAAIKGATSA